ncbi:type IVB secretion system protein IcmJDotN [Legionella pneumophila]|uniref:IcmJ protein n=1 Tax=Legionella pneumophila subsp. pascullei TaxID=91890 RepID=A0AAX2ITR6_LEGPN|nr:type IVB secretion system protein IcmJDotN [Legionella pneumophila]AMP88605.1 HNH endonuclease [Legionella pneumophila subsp. pascullei]AMP91514.1 type IV secretion protein IcmJ [Legionella pneumophila subsp. pascullei]AMP94501.1 type IV secretion protein IcmJ [Legionella pneumophila subsp. pascullei]SQG89303.1 IcmJ protein [Legionella pneumophila subsp. pascullei]VEH04441.1 IcmJ protein [Legionella pneumophila subsp. pascullei]
MADNQQRCELKLIASPGSWRLYSARKIDERFKSYEQKIFQRDRFTCQFCGFQARLYQDIVNLDGDYTNNRLSNLVTACCFCAQCFFVESVGVGGYGGGTLIYLPELTQAELNSLCHVLFCAITNDTGYKSSAQNIYRSFKFRSQIVEEKFGEGTSDPAIFGQLMIDSGVNSEEIRQKLFKNIRLLPSRAKFRKQIEKWAASALEEIAD